MKNFWVVAITLVALLGAALPGFAQLRSQTFVHNYATDAKADSDYYHYMGVFDLTECIGAAYGAGETNVLDTLSLYISTVANSVAGTSLAKLVYWTLPFLPGNVSVDKAYTVFPKNLSPTGAAAAYTSTTGYGGLTWTQIAEQCDSTTALSTDGTFVNKTESIYPGSSGWAKLPRYLLMYCGAAIGPCQDAFFEVTVGCGTAAP